SLLLPADLVVAKLLEHELDLGRAIDVALELVLEATGAERGFLLLRDERGHLAISRGRGLNASDLPPALSTSILGAVERTREPLLLSDAVSAPGFADKESVKALGKRSIACFPVISRARDELVGIVYLDSATPGRFGPATGDLLRVLGRAVAVPLENARRFEAQRRALERARDKPPATAGIVGRSPGIEALLALIEKVASHDVPVLIEGESGTGKELAARALHARSGRRGPFVAENLAALPETLAEAELFGVRKGAFTGAEDRDGIFVRARGGTVLLDEIGELPLELQPKLLRVLQEREVRPLGASAPVPVDARVIAATNKDLAALAKAGRFREDLLYRLKVISLRVPPLRERLEDLPLIAEHFLEAVARERGEPVLALSRAALAKLARRPWPGNVRELENVLWRVTLSGESAIDERLAVEPSPDAPLSIELALGAGPVPLEAARQAFDRAYLGLILKGAGGNIARAARELGMTRQALSRILRRLDSRP
ncbi:MAG TPA: sigma 54-interacting transcriptional regulator, partial [Planctomycetota bacterium]|nr:sigma 54-interacting transcriptional regulator [Planctomycetota bacterium]